MRHHAVSLLLCCGFALATGTAAAQTAPPPAATKPAATTATAATVSATPAAANTTAAAATAGTAPTTGKKDNSPRAQTDELRPTGPITVKADTAEWVQNDRMKYTGNVSMVSDTMTVRGDSMEVHQLADGNFEAWVHGKPATLDHAADPTAQGAAQKPLHASANEIHYNSQSGRADLNGAAHIKRGDDEVSGDTIGYIVPERRIQAASGGKGQVTITFQPPPQKDKKGTTAPATGSKNQPKGKTP
ncbi:lipopolysaccharide transport periplasmic protein LptA [Solimonas marina]|uniref:Lipopolysaccharide transport periplasmic protein LptA n=1 Tax=Solimonas marina TaxID=2714601 RepID=A0A969WCI1_9GAMM|nr:lipopolysaccharide transport periplasmic protein LptA [Solimonas marina]NKF22906.1 lipopolysaccharide transport periplasmic protein LptA [Solimonas marina]